MYPLIFKLTSSTAPFLIDFLPENLPWHVMLLVLITASIGCWNVGGTDDLPHLKQKKAPGGAQKIEIRIFGW